MTLQFIIRLVAAGLCGAVIGFEREYRAKEAGVRTHFLVALGSGLFMIISQYAFGGSFDSSRVAAQVVSGIGFIGAGTIIFQKNAVRGLTTAAGLWVTAAIGLACGAGMYVEGGAVSVLAILVLEIMHFIHLKIGEKQVAAVFSSDDSGRLMDIVKAMDAERSVESFYVSRKDGKYYLSVQMRVRSSEYAEKISAMLEDRDGVSVESIE